MPVSVVLSNISFLTPDRTPLFDDLNLAFGQERTGLVGRNGTGKSTLLRLVSGQISPAGGSVAIAGTIGWMRQDVGTAGGETIADLFGVASALALLDRAAAGMVADAAALADADWSVPDRIEAALAQCGLRTDPRTPLASLSGGQRTRAAFAAIVFAAPDVVLLDEPTNNLDRAGRRAVVELVRGWRRGAIVASHDRELLDEMDAIVELSTLGAKQYGGNFSAYRARKAEDLHAAERDVADAEHARHVMERRARQAAERKARKDSVGRKSRARRDQPKSWLDAAKARAEASGAANVRLRQARRDAAEETLSAARAKIEVLQPLRMDIPSTGLPKARPVLRVRAVTGGHDPARPVIRDLSLAITGPERVAVTGPNGCGKTTLLSLVTGAIAPVAGQVDLQVPAALLDQHVGLLDPARSLRDNFRQLNPTADENQCRAALARFMFRGDDALLLAGNLSGGEMLRAGLACTLGSPRPPALLILDEPTNHLDLDATEALEAALSVYDGALLVVSHDEAFLARLEVDRRVDLGETAPSEMIEF